MAKHADPKIIKNADARHSIYLITGLFSVAGILATLITFGVICLDDVKEWASVMITLVALIAATASNVLAALNTGKDVPTVSVDDGDSYQDL